MLQPQTSSPLRTFMGISLALVAADCAKIRSDEMKPHTEPNPERHISPERRHDGVRREKRTS
jgi:hypothetical protein